MTQKEYEELIENQKIWSRNNDYTNMIIIGDSRDLKMKEYYKNNICKHQSTSYLGGIDVCNDCGKQW